MKELSQKLPQLQKSCVTLPVRFKVFLNIKPHMPTAKEETKTDASSSGCWCFKNFFGTKSQKLKTQKPAKYKLVSEQVKEERISKNNAPFLRLVRKMSVWRQWREGKKEEAKELIALDLLGKPCDTD